MLKYSYPITINYRKKICKEISQWILCWRPKNDDIFVITDKIKERDLELNYLYKSHYRIHLCAIEYELEQYGHFNYDDYFDKYPNYHLKHYLNTETCHLDNDGLLDDNGNVI